MTLGQRIQCVLKEKNLKQVEFAKTLGISSNYVNLLVNGKKTNISDTLAKLIEETYGYSSQWIMEESGDKLITNNLTEAKLETIKKVKRMSDSEINALLAFINSLEDVTNAMSNHKEE